MESLRGVFFLFFVCFFLSMIMPVAPCSLGLIYCCVRYSLGEHLTMLWNHTTLSASHSGFSSQTAQLNTVQLGIFSQDLNFWASNWLVSTLLWVITLMNVKKKKNQNKTKQKEIGPDGWEIDDEMGGPISLVAWDLRRSGIQEASKFCV